MKTIKTTCLNCEKEFDALEKEVKRGNGKYCSKSCACKMNRKLLIVVHEPNLVCSYCLMSFYRSKSKLSSSSSGLYFCCKAHKDLAQRLDFNLKEIWPDHFGKGTEDSSYRKVAFLAYEKICMGCGYNSIPAILEVHHKDRNRKNNAVENLEVLCPTCHEADHYLSKTGKWTPQRAARDLT